MKRAQWQKRKDSWRRIPSVRPDGGKGTKTSWPKMGDRRHEAVRESGTALKCG
jgi:hypothetical protein